MALTELWHAIGYAEDGARIITGAVLLVGLLGMLVALYSTLQERRREMAIFRSLGAGRGGLRRCWCSSRGCWRSWGAVVGVALVLRAVRWGRGFAGALRRLHPITAPQPLEWFYLVGVVVAGVAGQAPPRGGLTAIRRRMADHPINASIGAGHLPCRAVDLHSPVSSRSCAAEEFLHDAVRQQASPRLAVLSY
ncbi:MAG: hypothetical protein IPP98_06820 [Gemmatimonadetes bacterium]|nr:hypothetical protein [Gemmatimonadota bacterium]